jgi:ubiquitin C-terminal hydrolase
MPQFSAWAQQDSDELFRFMLDGIHEDLNCVRTPSVDTEGVRTRVEQSWKRHTDANSSAVVDLFHGQSRSGLTGADCGGVTVIFDPFLSIALPVRRPNLVHASISLTLFGAVLAQKQSQIRFFDFF